MLQATNDFLGFFLSRYDIFWKFLIVGMKRIEIARNSYIVSPLWGHLTSRNSSAVWQGCQIFFTNCEWNEAMNAMKIHSHMKPQFVSYLSSKTQLKRLNVKYRCAVYPLSPPPPPSSPVFRWAVSLYPFFVRFFSVQTENFPFEIYWVQKHFFASVVCFLFRNLYLSNAHSFTHSLTSAYRSFKP